jgi:hypothetical protein
MDRQPPALPGQFGQIGIGWLRGSFPQASFDQVLELLLTRFGSPVIEKGIWRYEMRMKFENGIFIACNDMHSKTAKAEHFAIEVQGGVLEAMEGEEILSLFQELSRLGLRASRIDCSFDDHDHIIDPDTCYGLADKGDMIGFRRIGLIQTGEVGEKKGATATFGTRGQMAAGSTFGCMTKPSRVTAKSTRSAGNWKRRTPLPRRCFRAWRWPTMWRNSLSVQARLSAGRSTSAYAMGRRFIENRPAAPQAHGIREGARLGVGRGLLR